MKRRWYLRSFVGAVVAAALTFVLMLAATQLYLITHAGRLDRTPLPGEGVEATYLFGIPPYWFWLLPAIVGIATGAAMGFILWIRRRHVDG